MAKLRLDSTVGGNQIITTENLKDFIKNFIDFNLRLKSVTFTIPDILGWENVDELENINEPYEYSIYHGLDNEKISYVTFKDENNVCENVKFKIIDKNNIKIYSNNNKIGSVFIKSL